MVRLAFFFLNLCLINVLWAQADNANEGQRVIDEELFDAIRGRYNGSWHAPFGGFDGEAKAEVLRDSSSLIEIDGKMAELLFYNLTKASEDISYVPSVNNERYYASWLNYFDRISDNIACGLSSKDLKKDPFPEFKCRFRIDADGALYSFLDRDENTSRMGTPNDEWEGGQRDFHWRSVNEYKSEASVYSLSFQVYGKVASILYNSLNVNAQDEHWGPFPVKLKVGRQIWCAETSSVGEISAGEPSGYKCRIGFEPDGRAFHDH